MKKILITVVVGLRVAIPNFQAKAFFTFYDKNKFPGNLREKPLDFWFRQVIFGKPLTPPSDACAGLSFRWIPGGVFSRGESDLRSEGSPRR